jgi:hypothetical protein
MLPHWSAPPIWSSTPSSGGGGEVVRLQEHVAELGERQPASSRTWTESLASMYGIVKCLPMSRRKSIRRQLPEPVEVVDHDAPAPGVKSRKRSSCDRSDATFASSVARRAGSARWSDPRDRRSCPSRRRPPRPAAAEPLEPEQPEDRHEVPTWSDAPTDRTRCSRDRAAVVQRARQTGRGRVEDAAPLELGSSPPARARPRGSPSQA